MLNYCLYRTQLQISIDYLDLNLDMLADIPCQGVQDNIAELHSSHVDDSELVEKVVDELSEESNKNDGELIEELENEDASQNKTEENN